MTYEECVASIEEGTVVTFREYSLDRHEKRHLTLEIKDSIVYKVLAAGAELSRETLEEVYGTELDDIDYLQLSCMNCPRFVLSLGVNGSGELDVKVVTLNKDYYNMHLQEIEILNKVDSNNLAEPNYLLFQNQRGW